VYEKYIIIAFDNQMHIVWPKNMCGPAHEVYIQIYWTDYIIDHCTKLPIFAKIIYGTNYTNKYNAINIATTLPLPRIPPYNSPFLLVQTNYPPLSAIAIKLPIFAIIRMVPTTQINIIP